MENVQSVADKSAIAVSTICALHCLILPVAVVMYPSTLGFLPGDETIHLALLFVVIPISSFALFRGAKVHKKGKIFAVGTCGLFILVLAVAFGHDILGEIGEKVLTVIGSLLVVTAHIQNHLTCQRTDCDCHDE